MENRFQTKAQRSLGVQRISRGGLPLGYFILALLVAGGLPAARAQVVESQPSCCAHDLGEPTALCITIDIGTGEEVDDSMIITTPGRPRREGPNGDGNGPEMPDAPDSHDEERPDGEERRRPDALDTPQPTLQIVDNTPTEDQDTPPPSIPARMPVPAGKPKPGSDKPN